MRYSFDAPVDRFGTNSVKYDEMPNAETIPLWVADMDFETAPVIREALVQRMQHGCFGYTFVPDSFYLSTIQWFARRHGWQGIRREWFIYTSGVVPAISAIIKALTVPGDKVLVQSPVYNCFYSSIRNNGCELADVPLVYADARYTIDFESFERACSDPRVKVFLLCNPHNPAGRVWTKEELTTIGDICLRHNVFVIADEIHCEFVNKGYQYTPFASISEAFAQHSATCVSPSKAFNLAGLQIANIIVPDAEVRSRVDRAININEVCDVNPFGVIALQAAYTPEGEEWLDQLNAYIYANYEFAKSFIDERMPQLHVTALEGTYLMWVDIADLTEQDSDAFAETLFTSANVYVNPGTMYGSESGRKFIRINLATQRARLQEALLRILSVVQPDA